MTDKKSDLYPLMPLRDIVIFPHTVTPLVVGRRRSIRALEDAILRFSGCVVVVSHDRWFLDRVATHILAFEGDSRTVWFEGNWQAYEEDRRRRLGKLAETPRRITYRKLTR